MPFAIRVHETGGPDVLRWEELPLAAPAPGEVRVRHTAVGLNFVDVYHRKGLYPLPLPFIAGQEAAGRIEAVGAGVTGWKVGDRVAYQGVVGAYCEARNMKPDKLLHLPDAVTDELAAASLLKGMTAEYLLNRTFPVRGGQTILFHAAAGGTGQIAVQWAKHLGARVIGTVGTRAKVAAAKAVGCDEVIVTSEEDFAARVREITGGKGVPVVYDSIGKDTLLKSFECLSPRGTVVLFGQASGPVTQLDPAVLARGSYYLTRPSLGVYTATREELESSANALFAMIASGALRIDIGARFALKDAAAAHRALEGRGTTGSVLLIP